MKNICNIILVSLLSFPVLADEQPKPQVDELTSAYQREILFLSTYKKELKSKITTVQKSLGSKLREAEKNLKGMEDKWLSLQTSNELLMQKLSEVEADFENRNENKELLDTTIKQAQMDKKTDSAESNKPLVEKLNTLFGEATTKLSVTEQVQSAQGTFYGKKGDEKKGMIHELGGFAKFASLDGKVAALYPSGQGTFRVWKWLDGGAAGLVKGQIPAKLQFFLFDNPEKEFVAQKEKTALDVVQSGGLIGWIIVAMGLFALAISGIRFWLLQKARARNDKVLTQAVAQVASGQYEKAQHSLLREDNAISRVLTQTLSFLKAEPQKVEDAIQESILKESQLIDRFGVVILVIASVAPLMGLLGTVTGMISTFDIITLYGTGNPKLLSGGISEALVTTMLGLIVAIPALLIGQFLSAQNEKIKSDMEKWALALCNAFTNKETNS